jgi:hypothetical protein
MTQTERDVQAVPELWRRVAPDNTHHRRRHHLSGLFFTTSRRPAVGQQACTIQCA